MRVRRGALVAVLVIGGLLVGCGGDDDGEDSGAGAVADTDGEATGTDGDSDGDVGSVRVVIEDGPDAGEHEGSGIPLQCGPGPGDSFGAQYRGRPEAGKLSSVLVVVDDAEAGASDENEFDATVGFGALADGTSYEVESGTATVGVAPTISVEGTTEEGFAITIEMTCPAEPDRPAVRANILDGPDEGEYEVLGAGVDCRAGLADGKAFGVRYVGEGELSALEVLIRDADGAAEGVDDFDASLTVVGADAGGTEYEIESGTATVDVEEESPTLTVEGTTEDDVLIAIEVRCP